MGFGEVVAVDPGLRGCGVALFRLGHLVKAVYIHNPSLYERGPIVHVTMAKEVCRFADQSGVTVDARLVLEFPQAYAAKHQKGDQNDILEVAGVASATAALLRERGFAVHHYLPRAWKGTIKKEVMARRIVSRLAESESKAIVRESEDVDHNTIDAVGIGLAYLGRLNERASN